MALIKSLPTSYQVNATYWRVTNVEIDWIQRYSRVTIGGYIDADARQKGGTPLATNTFLWGDGEFPIDAASEGGVNIRKAVYDKIKESSASSEGVELNPWSNAKDG